MITIQYTLHIELLVEKLEYCGDEEAQYCGRDLANEIRRQVKIQKETFNVGDKVKLISLKRKYNEHINIPLGAILTVVDNPNPGVTDQIQISFENGEGAIDKLAVEKIH